MTALDLMPFFWLPSFFTRMIGGDYVFSTEEHDVWSTKKALAKATRKNKRPSNKNPNQIQAHQRRKKVIHFSSTRLHLSSFRNSLFSTCLFPHKVHQICLIYATQHCGTQMLDIQDRVRKDCCHNLLFTLYFLFHGTKKNPTISSLLYYTTNKVLLLIFPKKNQADYRTWLYNPHHAHKEHRQQEQISGSIQQQSNNNNNKYSFFTLLQLSTVRAEDRHT